jgi:hypothetical protein
MLRYLLGELPRYQHKQVEQKFFSDNAFFDQLLEVEEELINDYVLGRLQEAERLQFERNFLNTPQRRRKVELYRNRQQGDAATEAHSSQSSSTVERSMAATGLTVAGWWNALKEFFQGRRLIGQIAVACVAVALLIGLWVYISNKKNGDRLASNLGNQPITPTPSIPVRSTQATPPATNDNSGRQVNENIMLPERPANTAQPPRKTQPGNSNSSPGDRGAAPVVATLVPGLLRDNSQVPTVALSSGGQSLVLNIELQEDMYESYRAVLMRREQGQEDKRVYGWPRSRSRRVNAGASLNLLLPAGRLTSGFYYLELYGSSAGEEEKVDRYPFEIIKR